tara:strand:- start:400 stop:1275 length:876 start_codon:yes stop_codon:yes gene_type:complete
MNILLLGSNGAIGSNFLKQHLGDKRIKKIYSVDNFNHNLKQKKLLNHKKHVFLKHNLEKSDNLKLNKKIKFDCVIFLAFNVHFKNFDENEFFIKNMKIFYNSLEIIRNLKIRKVIYASSFAVYGDLTSKKLNENSKTKAVDVYSDTKIRCEDLIKHLSKNNYKYIILRYSQVFGEDVFTNIIANFIKMKNKNQTVTLFGNGKQFRDFVSVFDVCEATLRSTFLKSKKNYIFNICSGVPVSILYIAKKIGLNFNLEKSLKGPKKVVGSNKLATKYLYWKPKYSLELFLNKNI